MREDTFVPGSHEGGVALAQAAGFRLYEFGEVAGVDERWAKARAHSGAADLFRALGLVRELFRSVRTGLELANAERELSSWEKDQLRHAIKVAKKGHKRLQGMAPDFSDLHERAKKAIPLNDCASAWLEALPLVGKERAARPRDGLERIVGTVTDSRPDLAKRMRLGDAVRKAGRDKVLDIVALLWANGHDATRREVAYQLTALAFGIPITARHTIRHACEFAKKRHDIRPTTAKS